MNPAIIAKDVVKTNDFSIVFDALRFAAGWNWKCAKCNRLCVSTEAWFPCKMEFLPVKIKCLSCNTTWRLTIDCEKETCH
jgi:hypothetical protein